MTPTTDREPVRDPQDLARFLIARELEGDAEGNAALY